MLHKIILSGLCLLLLSLTACQQETEKAQVPLPESSEPVIARVGDQYLHESDIDREIRSLPESLQHVSNDLNARKRILEVLIRRAALSQHASELGLDTDPDVQARITRARNNILIQALEDWQVSQLPEPSAEAITQYYNQHLADFTVPEQIHARHILVRTEKQAKELRYKLTRQHGDFKTLASEFSIDDSNKSLGGDLNWFPRGVMVKDFEEAAFALKSEGDISQPVQTQYGWHLIELLGRKPASRKSMKEARDEIIAILHKQQLENWMHKITQDKSVEIFNVNYRPSTS